MARDLSTRKLGGMWRCRRRWSTSPRSGGLVLVFCFILDASFSTVHALAQPSENGSSSRHHCGNLVNATTPSESLLNGTQSRKQSTRIDASFTSPTRIPPSFPGPTASPPPSPPARKKWHVHIVPLILIIVLVAVVALSVFTITIYCFYKKRYVDSPAPAKPGDGVSLNTCGAEISILSGFGDAPLARSAKSTTSKQASSPSFIPEKNVKLFKSPLTKMKRVWSEPPSGTTTSSGTASRYTSTDTVSLCGSVVERATRNFVNKIGEGGFGPVYFGKLPGSKMEVAVKVQAKDSSQGAREFATEVEILSRAKHPNLVSLIGYSEKNGGYMLVYEFLRGGTLQDRLYGDRCHHPLDWKARLRIAVQAAKAIAYLHNDCEPSIIHRDVKSNNILLTKSGDAKVTDFGLSKFLEGNAVRICRCSVKGTSGYVDPEYYETMSLTQKSDVYSFGVVLLELISGREPIDTSLPREHCNITDWARNQLSAGELEAVVDRVLQGQYNLQSMWMMAELAMMCVEPKSIHRPPMSQVVLELEFAVLEEGEDTTP